MEVKEEIGKLTLHTVVTNQYANREEMMDGRKHLVVPVVMMVEGVHSGSGGPMLHQGSELARNLESWNGIPVTISHPKEGESNISANEPTVLDRSAVGRIFHTHYDDRLRAEAWIDLAKITEKSPTALAYIRSGRPLEVSVGVFNDTEFTEGEWNGETYESIASNYRPDHLALLPGERGACSWEDGCGIRANQEGGNMPEDLLTVFKDLNAKGYAVSPITNEQGYRELTELLQTKLNALDNDERVYYLQEVYSDYFIYAVHARERGETTLFKRGYSMTNNEVTWDEAPVEVRKKIEYVTMSQGMVRARVNINKKGGNMSKEGNLCCEAKVDALIANESTRWEASDKEWLLTLGEEVIEKMSPMEPEKVGDPTPTVNKAEVIDEFKTGLTTIEDYTALMPEEMKVQVAGGVKLYKEHREALVQGIIDNTAEGIWKKETLEAMNDETLESVSKSVNVADYSGQGIQTNRSNGEFEEKLLPVGVGDKRKEEK